MTCARRKARPDPARRPGNIGLSMKFSRAVCCGSRVLDWPAVRTDPAARSVPRPRPSGVRDHGVGKSRGGLAAHDRRGLMDESVVGEGVDHELGEIDTSGDVALQDGVTDVPAPYRKTLTFSFFQVAGAYERPVGVAKIAGRVSLDDQVEACRRIFASRHRSRRPRGGSRRGRLSHRAGR